MKRKEVEDVIGGKDAWENVDKADGEFVRGFFLESVVVFFWVEEGETGKVA